MKSNKLSKLSFNYDLGGLANYTDQLSADIISEAVLTPITMKYVNIVPGIKGQQNINLLSETLAVQTGTTCGWNSEGQVTFTVTPVTVQALKVNQSLCLQQLNQLWLGQYLNSGSYNTEAPFEQAILDLQVKKVKRYNEDLLWNASTGTSSFSGFIEIFANSVSANSLSNQTALCSVTGATVQEQAYGVLAQVDNLIQALNRNVYDRDDIIVYMSQTQFKCYCVALRNVNNFHFSEPTLGQIYEVFHPQTNYKIVGVPGLNGSDLIVAGPMQYMIVGTDLTSDEDGFRSWFSQDFQEVRFLINWKLGTAVAFQEFFVTNGL